MTQWRRNAAMALVAILLAGGAHAAQPVPTAPGVEEHEPNPGAALAAAGLNVLFLPLRLPLTVLGAALGGLTGFMTFGGKHAADDVFGLVDGTQVINVRVLEGREPFCIGSLDCPATR
ncbi:hypothetical protein KF840_10365 [bacterium]|nr:hypothetical protein [bacterium]